MFAPTLPFAPAPLARGPHRQTLAGAVLPCGAPRVSRRPDVRSLPIALRCGGRLEAWLTPGRGTAAVALLHGLGGSVDSPYVRACVAALADAGIPALAVAQRGSGGALERTRRPYMTGHVADAADVVRALRERGLPRVLLVGFSISGNTVLKLMGAEGETRPDAAIAVAPPVDLDRASREIARAYDLWILRSCRRWIPRLRGDDAGIGPVPALSGLRTFDRNYIGPVWGFASLDEYYADASAARHLAAIDRPTLVLQAEDDPVVPPHSLLSAARSPSVRVDLTRGGGHLGWVESRGALGARRWLPRAIAHHARRFAGRANEPVRRRTEEAVPC